MKYEEYVEKHILQPLGLANTGFDYTKRFVLMQYRLQVYVCLCVCNGMYL